MSIQYNTADYQGFKVAMVGVLQELLPEYTDISETDCGIVILECVAKMLDVISYYQNSQANECLLPTAELRSSVLKWSNILGYLPRSGTPAKFQQYFKISENAGEVFIPKGYIIRTKDSLSKAEYFTTLDDLRINTDKPIETQAGYVTTVYSADGKTKSYIFSVDIAHGTLIYNEVVGIGEAEVANQKFTLSNTPVVLPDYDEDGRALIPYEDGSLPNDYDIARDFSVTVGGKVWTLKKSFVDSGVNSPDFRAEIAQDNSVTLIFGDGVNGAIPVGDIVVNYRKGGGSVGNVGAHTIVVCPSAIAGVEETYNPDMAYIKGQDKELVSEIKLNAPNSYRTKWGCLIEEDFADKVIELFPEISMAQSFNITKNPDVDLDTLSVLDGLTDEFEIKNKLLDTVQLCVLVDDDIINDDGSYKKLEDFPDINGDECKQLKQSIMNRFEGRSVIGTFVELTPFTSKTIYLDCTLLPQSGYVDNYRYSELLNNVKQYMNDYFVVGNIKAGQTLSLNELEADIYANIQGIRAFRINSYFYDGEEIFDLDIPSELWEIIELDLDNTVIKSSRG